MIRLHRHLLLGILVGGVLAWVLPDPGVGAVGWRTAVLGGTLMLACGWSLWEAIGTKTKEE